MKKSISLLLAVMMVLTLFVGMVPAASAEDTNPDPDGNGLVTSKVYDPTTGKLTIEAYAKGEVTRTTTTSRKPLDIVLVLDVSGSMEDPMTNSPVLGNKSSCANLDKTKPQGYYSAYKDGLSSGARSVRLKNGNWQWEDNFGVWRNIQGGSYNIAVYKSKLGNLMDAANAFIDTVANDATSNGVDHKISIVTFASSSEIKKESLSASTDATTLHNTINGLTAGGATQADLGMKNAKGIMDKVTRDSNKVVVLFTDGVPTSGSSFEGSVANSAIGYAKDMKHANVTVYSVGVFDSTPKNTDNTWKYMNGVSSNYYEATKYDNLGTRTSDKFYFTPDSADALNSVFQTIATESFEGGSFTKLDAATVVKDTVTDFFDLTYGIDKTKINVYTAPCNGEDSFGNKTKFSNANVSISEKTIFVTNFDFSGNWCGKDATTGKYRGEKLIIEIPITPNATIDASGTYPTNTGESGIYDGNGNSVEKLPVPEIKVAEETYVIDYAKAVEVESKDWDQDRIDGIYDKVGSDNDPNMTYGDVSKTSTTITYTPKTMEWDGADTLYSYYNTSDTDHIWAKVNFVPANNVYYEDDFATISYNDTWTTDGRSTNQQEFANSIHGGVDNSTLVDDTTYSDGSAHKAVASKDKLPSASFTFTGTGVDVYSRTNSETGTVMAVLSGNGVNKVMTVDNLLKQGKDFYQVPTVSFADLPYGTYTVTIYVSTAAGDRVTYYLDGVRVYNPTQDTTLYDVSERNAQFVEVRDLLIDADDFGVKEGIVFTDNGNAFDVATYKKYGPENEVYLAKGQAIMFQVNNVGSGTDYYIGMSAPEGSATAKMTNGASASVTTVGHASDLYYKVTPNADGFVIIENTGDNMLAISKLRVAGEVPVTLFAMAKAPMMSYANSFSTLSVVPYEEEAVDPVVDPTDPIVDPIVDPEPTPDPEPTHTSIFENLFKFIKNLFSWR